MTNKRETNRRLRLNLLCHSSKSDTKKLTSIKSQTSHFFNSNCLSAENDSHFRVVNGGHEDDINIEEYSDKHVYELPRQEEIVFPDTEVNLLNGSIVDPVLPSDYNITYNSNNTNVLRTKNNFKAGNPQNPNLARNEHKFNLYPNFDQKDTDLSASGIKDRARIKPGKRNPNMQSSSRVGKISNGNLVAEATADGTLKLTDGQTFQTLISNWSDRHHETFGLNADHDNERLDFLCAKDMPNAFYKREQLASLGTEKIWNTQNKSEKAGNRNECPTMEKRTLPGAHNNKNKLNKSASLRSKSVSNFHYIPDKLTKHESLENKNEIAYKKSTKLDKRASSSSKNASNSQHKNEKSGLASSCFPGLKKKRNQSKTRNEKAGRAAKDRNEVGGRARSAYRERSRVEELRRGYSDLQAAIPAVPRNTKLAKLEILVLAASYISHLTQLLEDEQVNSSNLRHPSAGTDYKRGGPATSDQSCQCSAPPGKITGNKWPMRARLYEAVGAIAPCHHSYVAPFDLHKQQKTRTPSKKIISNTSCDAFGMTTLNALTCASMIEPKPPPIATLKSTYICESNGPLNVSNKNNFTNGNKYHLNYEQSSYTFQMNDQDFFGCQPFSGSDFVYDEPRNVFSPWNLEHGNLDSGFNNSQILRNEEEEELLVDRDGLFSGKEHFV